VAGALAAGGWAALASKGAAARSASSPRAQLRELQTVLDAGPAVSGWDDDQCWTLARIAEAIRARFGVGYSLPGTDLLHRIGGAGSPRPPGRRAGRGADHYLAGGQAAGGKRTAADHGRHSVSRSARISPVWRIGSRIPSSRRPAPPCTCG